MGCRPHCLLVYLPSPPSSFRQSVAAERQYYCSATVCGFPRLMILFLDIFLTKQADKNMTIFIPAVMHYDAV